MKTGLKRAFRCEELNALVTPQNCYVEKDGQRWQRLEVRFRRVGTQYQWAPVGHTQREVEAMLNAKYLLGHGEARTLSDNQVGADSG